MCALRPHFPGEWENNDAHCRHYCAHQKPTTILTRALANIAEQTYQDYAVYVVNDGGDRAEAERIVTASPVADKTTLLHTDGIGMEAASNLGVRESESTYVTVHDDDDLWAPKFLKHTARRPRIRPGRICAPCALLNGSNVKPTTGSRCSTNVSSMRGCPLLGCSFLYRTNRAVPIGVIYRRACTPGSAATGDDLAVVGDWEFNMRAAAEGEIITIDEPLDVLVPSAPKPLGAAANSVEP